MQHATSSRHTTSSSSVFMRVLTAPYLPPSLPKDDSSSNMTNRESLVFPNAERPWCPPVGCYDWMKGMSLRETRTLLAIHGDPTHTFRISTVGSRRIGYIAKSWSLQENLNPCLRETILYRYRKYLKGLQGDSIPTLITVQADDMHVIQLFDWPHHGLWIEASDDMPNVLKVRCIEALRKIHTAGVVHGNLQRSNMLIGGDCQVTITDFSKSRALITEPKIGLQQARPEDFRMEMRKLKCMLNYGESRQKETEKIQRAFDRQRRQRAQQLGRGLKTEDSTGSGELLEQPAEEDILDPPPSFEEWETQWNPIRVTPPRRVVVPGRTADQIKQTIDDMLEKIHELDPSQPLLHSLWASGELPPRHSPLVLHLDVNSRPPNRKRPASPNPSSREQKRPRLGTPHPPTHSRESTTIHRLSTAYSNKLSGTSQLWPPSAIGEASCRRLPFFEARDHPGLTYEERKSLLRHALIRAENARRCRERGLPYFDRGRRTGCAPPGYGLSLGALKRRQEDRRDPGGARRRGEARKAIYRDLKAKGVILDSSGLDPAGGAEDPSILIPETLQLQKKVVGTRRSERRTGGGILRNKRAGPGPINHIALRACDVEDEISTTSAASDTLSALGPTLILTTATIASHNTPNIWRSNELKEYSKQRHASVGFSGLLGIGLAGFSFSLNGLWDWCKGTEPSIP